MAYDANLSTVDLEIERLRPERRRHGPRNTNNLTPAVKMVIGDWHVDEFGILTREITARD
jgi:hypothetical protein